MHDTTVSLLAGDDACERSAKLYRIIEVDVTELNVTARTLAGEAVRRPSVFTSIPEALRYLQGKQSFAWAFEFSSEINIK